MRKQYHIHKSFEGKTLIWDVARLIELSKGIEVKEVPLEALAEFDSPAWFAESDSLPTCREIAAHAKLIQNANLGYPIILSSDGRVMDGLHRICKAWVQGNTEIRAVQFSEDPEPDYVDVSLDELPYHE